MSEPIDPTRVAQLQSAIDALEAALSDGDRDAAARAAHSCRNDGLMVRARPLLAALARVEEAARAGQLATARAVMPDVREVWPSTRAELERLLGAPGKVSS